jgi:AraC-like DNA-binding protein
LPNTPECHAPLFAERFTRLLGEAPLTYVARCRMQLGARLLETTDDTVLQVALNAGYESEAAFNRAFRREFDLPPARYRTQRRSGDGPAVMHRQRDGP